jgi:hypothetical protein
MRKLSSFSALIVLLLATPAIAQQFDLSAFGGTLAIALSPQYPQPGQAVHLTVSGGSLDLQNSAIVWRTDGKVVAQGTGVTSADMVAGALGSEANIDVSVDTPDGTIASAQAIVAPTELDVLVGSDSYAPPFYLGRTLPSAGTNLILQAVAHFKRADGSVIPDSSITYTWKRNDEVIASASGRGKAVAVISAPHLFTSDTITVDAVSSDQSRGGETSVLVPSEAPVLDLYEDHPLYGILFHRALSGSAFIPESEMTFAAVPYFAEGSSPSDRSLAYDWRVNSAKIDRAFRRPTRSLSTRRIRMGRPMSRSK